MPYTSHSSFLLQHLCTVVCIFFSIGFGAEPVFDYSFIENALKTRSRNHVEFGKVQDTPITYRAWGVWNLDHSASEVAAVALDFGQYSRIFQHVYRCERITTPPELLCSLGTWYVEGRAFFARVWAIGDIDTVCWTDSSHFKFIAHQNENRQLENSWSYRVRNWLNYRTHGVHLAACAVATGPGSCRLGVVAQGWVKQPMPQWLVRLATTIILSNIMGDLEKEVRRRAEQRRPKPKHWYDALIGN